MGDKLEKIIDHYGIIHQLKYFQSEVFELNEAIIKAENIFEPVQDIDHIKEEIADCYVMLEQFRIKYNIPLDEVYKVGRFKIDRQIERIRNE